MPCTIVEMVPESSPSTFNATSDAPGATPRIRMVHPGGSGEAGFTKSARS